MKWEKLSDGSLSQYVTFDGKHNCEVSLRYRKKSSKNTPETIFPV